MAPIEIPRWLNRHRAKHLARGIFCLCTLACLFGIVALSNSVLGFVVVFGGGVLGYESIVVIRGIDVREAEGASSRLAAGQYTGKKAA
jgi:hypothetical protein